MKSVKRVTESHRILRQLSRLHLAKDDIGAVRETVGNFSDWGKLVVEAEKHGLSPLAHYHFAQCDVSIPLKTQTQLRALRARHRRSEEIRRLAIAELLHRLSDQNIDVIVLKGAALAYMIYPLPELRPMRDVDILVNRDEQLQAKTILEMIGYREMTEHRIHRDHHHLPTLAKEIEGLTISVEIHRDAISPDNFGTITPASLSDQPRLFNLGEHKAKTLGHVDMLRHLCRHAFSLGGMTKLGSALDTLGYADRFSAEIDWNSLATKHPEVINSLDLLAYLIPCPVSLKPHLLAHRPQIQDVGLGLPPLSEVIGGPRALQVVMAPPDWWLHGFYVVRPGDSLAWVRLFRHPLTVLRWLWRRLKSKAGFFFSRQA